MKLHVQFQSSRFLARVSPMTVFQSTNDGDTIRYEMKIRRAGRPESNTTGTVEVPRIRDNDAALALGARPIQQQEPAARHESA